MARSVLHSWSFVWVHAFPRVGREAPVRTEPRPTALSDALCLEQILLVVVVVLDSLPGVDRSARVTRAAHPALDETPSLRFLLP
jgi:hypothetical protein